MPIPLLFLVALLSMGSYRASKVLVSLLALELGATEFDVGLLIALYAVFPTLLALFAGRLADRIGVRTPMAIGTLGSAAGLSLPFLVPSLPTLYASAALTGASYVFYHVAVQQLVGLMSKNREERTRNFSHYALVLAVAGSIGPVAAGLGIDSVGSPLTYLYTACFPLTAGLLVLLSPGLRGLRGTADPSSEKSVRDMLAHPGMRRVLLVSGIALAGNDLFLFFMPLYGHSISLSATEIGIILGFFSAAAFVVRLVIPSLVKSTGEVKLLTLCFLFGAATYVAFPFVHNVYALCAVAFVLGLSMGCGQPLSVMLAYSRAPEGRTGEALGMRLVVMHFTQIAVPVVFGSVSTALGVAPVFWGIAALLGGGGWLNRDQLARRGTP